MKALISGVLTGILCLWATPVRTEPPGAEATAMDGKEIKRKLSEGVEALRKQGKTAAMETLIGQLTRTRCKVTLEKAAEVKMTAPDIYRNLRKGVMVIGSIHQCEKCSRWHTDTSTGFVISTNGVLVTNYHVVNHPGHAAMGALSSEGKVYAVKEVLAADKDNDLALLQLDGSDLSCLALGPEMPVGSSIWVISHPEGNFYNLTEGLISGYSLEHKKKKDPVRTMHITADFGAGSSGAPVFNENGHVVGVVAFTQAIVAKSSSNEHDYAQMVVKGCVPVGNLRALIR